MGDLILLLACCYEDPNAQVVFFANGGSLSFCKQILEFFNLEHYISKNLMGSKSAAVVYDMMTSKINFKPSAHLSRGLDFADWSRDINYYKDRMVFKTDWKERIGINSNFHNKKTILIQPAGSTRIKNRQRYLEQHEYEILLNKFLDLDYNVITCGSDYDADFYKWKPNHHKSWFLNSNKIIGYKFKSAINMKTFLQTINSAEKIISMDTWIKTYTLLIDMPTYVINNRSHGQYLNYGTDSCDYIFINKDLWENLHLLKFEEILDLT